MIGVISNPFIMMFKNIFCVFQQVHRSKEWIGIVMKMETKVGKVGFKVKGAVFVQSCSKECT